MLVRPAALAVVLAAGPAWGCTHAMSQDATTGPDGWPTGAVLMQLAGGGATASGTVSYPAGNRVDWKRVDLPVRQRGTLGVALRWQPEHRDDQRLGFDVFDAWGDSVNVPFTGDMVVPEHTQLGGVEPARGSYWIRVYARDRADAGRYQLDVRFAPDAAQPSFDAAALVVPDPPHLPDVPADPECDEHAYDAANPACANKCPSPPDVRIAACQATMPCPSPPDRRVAACPASAWPACDLAHKDRGNPNCDHASYPPVVARIIRSELHGGDAQVFVTISAGKQQGVSLRWTGRVLRQDAPQPLSNGDVTLIRVDDTISYGTVRLTGDQLGRADRVELRPPVEP